MTKEIKCYTGPGYSFCTVEIRDESLNVRSATPAMVSRVSLSAAQWQAGLLACTQEVDSEGTETGWWYLDWDATGLTESALYHLLFYDESMPSPNTEALWEQADPTQYVKALLEALPIVSEIWNGLDATQLAKFASIDTGVSSAAAGSVAKLSQELSLVQGAGSIESVVETKDSEGNPLDGVEVWVTSDSVGDDVVAGTLTTDANGLVTFMLDAGTYYLWRQLSRYNFGNPQVLIVS